MFSDWHAAGAAHRTPVEPQRQAASLLDRHTSGNICKALSLDHRRLKRWRAELMNAGKSSAQRSAAFVEVPAGDKLDGDGGAGGDAVTKRDVVDADASVTGWAYGVDQRIPGGARLALGVGSVA